jgi:hypothetical protein
MAKVTYIDPIKSVSGKLTKSHSTVLNVRKARTSNQDMIDNPCYTSYRDPNKKVKLTAGQKSWNQTFKDICAATRDRMMDPSHISMDQLGFRNQTKYKTLYQYVWNLVRQEIENGK